MVGRQSNFTPKSKSALSSRALKSWAMRRISSVFPSRAAAIRAHKRLSTLPLGGQRRKRRKMVAGVYPRALAERLVYVLRSHTHHNRFTVSTSRGETAKFDKTSFICSSERQVAYCFAERCWRIRVLIVTVYTRPLQGLHAPKSVTLSWRCRLAGLCPYRWVTTYHANIRHQEPAEETAGFKTRSMKCCNHPQLRRILTSPTSSS